MASGPEARLEECACQTRGRGGQETGLIRRSVKLDADFNGKP